MGDKITSDQIFSYLNSLKVEEDKKHSLSIAIDCLEHVFDMDSLSLQGIENERVVKVQGNDNDKKAAEEFKNRGNEAMQAKNYQDAIKSYSEAIKLDESPVFFSNRSAAYISVQDFDNGLKDAEYAIELDVNFKRAYSRLGVCHFSKGDYESALAAYEKGLELDPGNPTLLQGLEKVKERLESSEVQTRQSAPAGMPDLGALGGMGGLAEMMKNPQMMEMAQQMMQNNPQMMQMAQQMMGGQG